MDTYTVINIVVGSEGHLLRYKLQNVKDKGKVLELNPKNLAIALKNEQFIVDNVHENYMGQFSVSNAPSEFFDSNYNEENLEYEKDTLILTRRLIVKIEDLGINKELHFSTGRNIKVILGKDALLRSNKVTQISDRCIAYIIGNRIDIITSCSKIAVSEYCEEADDLFAYTRFSAIYFENVDTSRVRSMYGWFKGSEAKYIDIKNLNTSKVICMSSMFSDRPMHKLDLSRLDTRNVRFAKYMFNNTEFYTLDLTKFDFRNLIDATGMLLDAKLQFLKIEGARFPNLKNTTDMLRNIFVESLNLNIYTPKLEIMKAMFKNSTFGTISIDIDTSHVTDMFETFSGVRIKGTLDLSKLDFSRVKNINSFLAKSHIDELVCPEMVLENTTQIHYLMAGTEIGKMILAIRAPKVESAAEAFSKLKTNKLRIKLDLPKLRVASNMFYNAVIPELDLTKSTLGELEDARFMFSTAIFVVFKMNELNVTKHCRLSYLFQHCEIFEAIINGQVVDQKELQKIGEDN